MAKKIGAIISLIIIGVVIVAAIVMANINIDYGVESVKPDKVWVQTESNQHLATDKEKSKIVDYISNASKQNALTALFNGELGKKAELVAAKGSIAKPSHYYVRYKYNTKQELMNGGKVFKNADGAVEKFEELVFVVADVKGEIETNVYVILNSDEINNYSYYYKMSANFEGLFSYLNETFA